ncbi:MAG: hypothetical protein ABI183_16610 [Polyangiaceae bacterium]
MLDAAGRTDGFYGVHGEQVDQQPLAHFEQMKLVSEGVDQESGKRWLQIRMTDAEASNVEKFTATPADRSLAVIVGGEVACRHKIRQAVTSSELQLSCCNPKACDRWRALLRH